MAVKNSGPYPHVSYLWQLNIPHYTLTSDYFRYFSIPNDLQSAGSTNNKAPLNELAKSALRGGASVLMGPNAPSFLSVNVPLMCT